MDTKKGFSDEMAGKVIAGQVKRIQELEGKLNGWFIERDTLITKIAGLEDRIGPIDPGGGDRIDELESAIAMLRGKLADYERQDSVRRTMEE